MLYSKSGIHAIDGVAEGCYGYPQDWAQRAPHQRSTNLKTSATPTNAVWTDRSRQAYLLLGDREFGPVIGLFNMAPGDGGLLRTHHHRTDTFRMPVGFRPEQLKEAGRWLGHGEFVALGANTEYSETVSTEGHMLFLVEANRKGSPSIFAKMDPEEVLRHWRENTQPDQFGDNDFSPYETDDEATTGLVTTFAHIPTPARLFGSIYDNSAWSELSDGSKVAAVFLDNPVSGPMVLLTNNTPGAVESPGGGYEVDRIRLILKGTCTIGDRQYSAQDFRATEAGITEGPVVHGPEGSSQVVVYADRRQWLPILDDGKSAVNENRRLGEIAAILEPYLRSAIAVG